MTNQPAPDAWTTLRSYQIALAMEIQHNRTFGKKWDDLSESELAELLREAQKYAEHHLPDAEKDAIRALTKKYPSLRQMFGLEDF